MKKLLPFILGSIAFTAFIVIQFMYDFMPTKASLSSDEAMKMAYYKKATDSLLYKTLKNEDLIVLKDKKAPVKIINFWASWCQPCLIELPSLVKLRETFSLDQLYILTINSDNEDQENIIQKITNEYGLNFDIVVDYDGKLSEMFKVSSLPFSLVLVNDKIHSVNYGMIDFMSENLLNLINQTVQK